MLIQSPKLINKSQSRIVKQWFSQINRNLTNNATDSVRIVEVKCFIK